MIARGERNNNPGNIDYHKENNWIGQTGIETGVAKPRFATFKSPEYGIRAICKILQGYRSKYGIRTIRAAIMKYAPPVENKTDQYAANVSKWSGLDIDQEFDPHSRTDLEGIVRAIIRQELGYQPYTDEVIRDGVALSLSGANT